MYGENRVFGLDAIQNKAPKIFKIGLDGNLWLWDLEKYLKNFDETDWLRITISFIDNSVLKCINGLEEMLLDTKHGFQRFKNQFLILITVNFKKNSRDEIITWDNLSDYKQNNESIGEYGRNICKMVKCLFPTVQESTDLDRLMQEIC